MSWHRLQQDLARAAKSRGVVDPGNGGQIEALDAITYLSLVTAAAETRTLSDPDAAGKILIMCLETDGGDCVVTASTAFDQTANSQLTFDDAGDIAVLVSVRKGSSYVWRPIVSDGIAELAYDAKGLTTHLTSAQASISLPLTAWREAATFAVANIVGNGGVLASNTTPILGPINGGTDGCQVLTWAAGNVDQVLTQVALPPDINTAAAMTLHCRARSNTTDAVSFVVESFFNEGDTKVSDATSNTNTNTYTELTATIAAADIPTGAQTLTIGLTPAAHNTDDMLVSAIWLEYTRKVLTS